MSKKNRLNFHMLHLYGVFSVSFGISKQFLPYCLTLNTVQLLYAG